MTLCLTDLLTGNASTFPVFYCGGNIKCIGSYVSRSFCCYEIVVANKLFNSNGIAAFIILISERISNF